jgi:hypothetical protein
MRRRGEQNTSIAEMRKSTKVESEAPKPVAKHERDNCTQDLLNSNRDKELRTFGTVTHTITCKW